MSITELAWGPRCCSLKVYTLSECLYMYIELSRLGLRCLFANIHTMKSAGNAQ